MKKEKTITCVSRQQLIRFKGIGFYTAQPAALCRGWYGREPALFSLVGPRKNFEAHENCISVLLYFEQPKDKF